MVFIYLFLRVLFYPKIDLKYCYVEFKNTVQKSKAAWFIDNRYRYKWPV